MQKFEYKVVPAPRKGKRGNGAHGADGKFANALMEVMNELGAEGWAYLRTDTLPVEARAGLTGKATTFQNMLVFQRNLSVEDVADTPKTVDLKAIPELHAPALPTPAPVMSAPVVKVEAPVSATRDVAAE